MIVFAHLTYHGAFPNAIEDVRLSCGIGFRAADYRIDLPWDIPDEGKLFIETMPAHLRRYLDGYTSIDMEWKAQERGATRRWDGSSIV